jgi:hypothetical protein
LEKKKKGRERNGGRLPLEEEKARSRVDVWKMTGVRPTRRRPSRSISLLEMVSPNVPKK